MTGSGSDGGKAPRPRPARKPARTSTRPDADVVPNLVPVSGIGRWAKSRRYCPDCGHPTGRCVCHAPDEAA